MTENQLYLAIGIPVLSSVALFAMLVAFINARFVGAKHRFVGINRQFDDMREMWRTELRRFEEVLGARVKRLENRRR